LSGAPPACFRKVFEWHGQFPEEASWGTEHQNRTVIQSNELDYLHLVGSCGLFSAKVAWLVVMDVSAKS
jgi:hypothetical protein